MKLEFGDLKFSRLQLTGIYRGVVEDNNDPLKNGRCRIRVFGVHSSSNIATETEGIPTSQLPWAEPVLGLIEGSISGYGLFAVPLQGSHVFVFFENGNHMKPRYFGSAPGVVETAASPAPAGRTPDAFTDPNGVYPDRSGTDFPTEAQTNYPENIVLKTHGGHVIEIDNTENAKRLKIYHSSGTNAEINNEGSVTITRKKDNTDNITGNATTTVGGDLNITISGNANVNISGDATITVTGKCNITGNPINLN